MNGKRLWIGMLMMLLVFSSGALLAMAEEDPGLKTEAMEIRTEGSIGLRIFSTINEAFLNEQKQEGKTVEYGTVVIPATVLEKNPGQELKLDSSYMLNGKTYKSMKIPAQKNWAVEEGEVTFNCVLTGIKGAGFNTRYAARAYVTVDGVTTYGDTINNSCYKVAKEMAASEDREDAVKKYVVDQVVDACDDAKKVTQDTLTIAQENFVEGAYTLAESSSVRNYKKVVVDDSVQSGILNLQDVRVRQLEISDQASCTINASGVIFDGIQTVSDEEAIGLAEVMSETKGIVLNLGEGTGLPSLTIAGNMTVNGQVRISDVTIAGTSKVSLAVPIGKLQVLEQAGNSAIVIDNIVEDAVLYGDNTVITGSGKFEKAEDKGNNEIQIDVDVKVSPNSIESVVVQGANRMIVTLNKATEESLTAANMAILCHGGSEMTILDVATQDQKVYEVTTSTFAKDDTYTFSIELEDGTIIQKEFSYRIDFPIASKVSVLRSETTRAEVDLYDVDEGGYIYIYIPGFTQVATRAAVDSGDITVDLVKKGYKQEIKTGFNKVRISGLDSGITYQMYYVLEGYGEDRVSDVYGPLEISGTVQEDPNISKEYQIVSVAEMPSNTFTIKLNKAPEEELSIDNFSFICPADSAINLEEASLSVSQDKLTYTITIPENYGHKDNSYTAKITFSDGTVAKASFVVHFNPPTIRDRTVTRTSEDAISIRFNSDEKGRVYIGTYSWNHSINAAENNTPRPENIIAGEYEYLYVLRTNYNEIEIEYNGTDTDVFLLYMDEAGNYTATDHASIPDYVPVDPDPTPIQIESVEYSNSWGPTFNVKLSDRPDYDLYQSDIQFTALSGVGISGRPALSIDSYGTELTISVYNGVTFQSGTYKITINVVYQGSAYTLEKEFEIP